MKIIEPDVEIITPISREAVLNHIENCGRICYQSSHRVTEVSAAPFVKGLIASGHESVIEHFSVSVKFICDRGVSHELVRHRLASFSQESTRYCNYSQEKFGKELTFIYPSWALPLKSQEEYIKGPDRCIVNTDAMYTAWKNLMGLSEKMYLEMLEWGAAAQEARAVLPNSLKTEIVVTANLREWRHILKLRTSKAAHPDMRLIMLLLLAEFQILLPEVFGDIEVKNA